MQTSRKRGVYDLLESSCCSVFGAFLPLDPREERREPDFASDLDRVGPRTIVILRPSTRGEDSIEPSSDTSSASLFKSRMPISGRDCSRPRNMIITLTLSPAERKRDTCPFLVS